MVALSRAVWDEFYRIALTLAQLDRPMCLAIATTEDINVDLAPAYSRMLNNGTPPIFSAPEGMLDSATGVITMPMEGLWQINVIVSVPPFLAAGNRDYILDVVLTLTPTVGPPVVRTLSSNGNDTQDLSNTAAALIRALRGDLLTVDARCRVSGGGAGTTPATLRFSFFRVSGVR